MNSPLAWVAIFLILGVSVSRAIQIPLIFTFLFAILFILISLFTIKRKIVSSIALLLTFFFIGCILSQVKQVHSANHIKNFTPSKPELVYLEGLITDEPQLTRTSYGEIKVNLILQAMGFQKDDIRQKVTGKVKVSVRGDVERLNYGDRILVYGLLSQPRAPGNPGQFDYAQYLKRRGIFSVLRAGGYNVLILERGKGNPIFRLAYSVRHKIEEMIDLHLPSDTANFLNAVLLGQRQDVDIGLNDIFVRTGTVHLLAVSGLHVGLLAFLVMLIFKLIRMPRKMSIILTISFLIFYCLLTSGRPSVIRATIIAQVLLFGWLIGRESSIWNSLGLAVIIILVLEPNAIFDVGFQLSFIAVASILYLTPRLENKGYLIKAAFISLAAWIGTLPFVLYHFNIVTPIAVISNLVAVPLTFLVIASSIPFIIFGFVTPFAGKIFAGTTWLLCSTLFGIAEVFSKSPFAYLYFSKPSIFFILIYYIFIIALVEHKRFKISISKISVAILLFINIIIWHSVLKPNDEKLKATFLDVGHGDSIFIEFPDGGNMLIDGGRGADYDAGRNIILPFLRNRGIRTLDAVVLTHPDSDHIGGLASVIEGLNVRRIFYSGRDSKTGAYLNFEDIITRKKIRRDILRRGDSIAGIKDMNIFCLNPPAKWVEDPAIKDNDASLVIKISYKEADLLFSTDIEERAKSNLLRYGPLLEAEVFMLPHHGEKLTSVGTTLIENISPKYAVISQGGSPKEVLRSKETEEALMAKGIRVFRTNRDGAIFVATDGKSILIDKFRN